MLTWVQKSKKKSVQKIFGTLSHENSTCAKGIIDDLVIVSDETIETTKSIITKTVRARSITINFYEKKVKVKMRNFYISITFLLITMILLITVSINCRLIKNRTK